MPEISRFYGIIIAMYYSEHNPPHFHVVYEWLDLRKEELLANWAHIENGETLVEIQPLD